MAVRRRDLLQTSALAAGSALAPEMSMAAAGPGTYESIGIRPVINCRGTLTIIGGSQMLPEVRKAMDEASRHFVQIDELMDAVGQRLAAITGAEYGIVTAGCAAALAHVTAACIAGSAPERMQRLPDTSGMKNEVLAPGYSRNEYDHAIRMTGAKIVEVADKDRFAAAFTSRTAMVMVLAGPQDSGAFGLPFIAAIAKQKGIPVIVDAAAEDMTIPNIHLQRGADIVCYSGGKVLRGPQCAGLALGRKDLLQAAWINSAPHHTFGRAMKIGREEIMGMLAAVEVWKTRDIQAEYDAKRQMLRRIAERVGSVAGVKADIRDTKELSNHAARLTVRWETARIPLTGTDVAMLLYEGSPRIDVGPSNRSQDFPADSISISGHMMNPGEEKIVGDRLASLLSSPPKRPQPDTTSEPAANLSGRWDVHIDFVHGSADHVVLFEQKGSQLDGTHFGEHVEGNLRGSVNGTGVGFRSAQRFEGTSLRYKFEGTVQGDQLAGTVNLGEYGLARWKAVRHKYGDSRG
ncbi:MAG: aminotransferase class V-fold PLP-dependent enzyme [Bryobacteraceae bacterium]|nr:aminotransferase class V-fold PLP-dependent enzyme [Bryobacteraceae bacterium]